MLRKVVVGIAVFDWNLAPFGEDSGFRIALDALGGVSWDIAGAGGIH